MERVVVAVRREGERQEHDLEVPTGVRSCQLARLIAHALRWNDQPPAWIVEAHPPGRVLRPDETLAGAGAWDGSLLILRSVAGQQGRTLAFVEMNDGDTWFLIPSSGILIGRAVPSSAERPGIDLTAYDPELSVSRTHALIFAEEDSYYVQDLQSRNGVYLNNASDPIPSACPVKLSDGDVLSLGAVDLVFRIERLD